MSCTFYYLRPFLSPFSFKNRAIGFRIVSHIVDKNARCFSSGCQNVEPLHKTSTEPSEIVESKTKLLKIALIGRPNAGKSTLINQIVGRTTCPVSMKAHTTRVKLRAFVNEGDTQLLFLDTPGIVSVREVKKFKFEPEFLRSAEEAVNDADIIGVLFDSAMSDCKITDRDYYYNNLDFPTVRLLHLYQQKPSFLVLNKIDSCKKDNLLILTEKLTRRLEKETDLNNLSEYDLKNQIKNFKSWPHFTEVFMVSALEGDGVGDIKEFLLQQAKPGPWVVTDNKVENVNSLAVDFVKAACLDFLPEEVPYKLKCSLSFLEDDGERCAVEVRVRPANLRHQKMLFDKIRAIGGYAEANFASALGKECRLRVQIEVLDQKPHNLPTPR